MTSKTSAYTMILTLTLVLGGYVQTGLAADIDKGPKEIILKPTKNKAFIPKPATFTHALHQVAYTCGECHHTRKDGKESPYVEAMAIKKCEECHFTGSSMPSESDEAKGVVKLDTFKNAAHARCRSCHDKIAKAKPELKTKWRGCLPCHE